MQFDLLLHISETDTLFLNAFSSTPRSVSRNPPTSCATDFTSCRSRSKVERASKKAVLLREISSMMRTSTLSNQCPSLATASSGIQASPFNPHALSNVPGRDMSNSSVKNSAGTSPKSSTSSSLTGPDVVAGAGDSRNAPQAERTVAEYSRSCAADCAFALARTDAEFDDADIAAT